MKNRFISVATIMVAAVFLSLPFAQTLLASVAANFTNNGAPTATVIGGATDKLVLDVNIPDAWNGVGNTADTLVKDGSGSYWQGDTLNAFPALGTTTGVGFKDSDAGVDYDAAEPVVRDLDADSVYTSAADTTYVNGADTPAAGDALHDVVVGDKVCADNSDLALAACAYTDSDGNCNATDGVIVYYLGAACGTVADTSIVTGHNWATSDVVIDATTDFIKENVAEELTYSAGADTDVYTVGGLSAGDALIDFPADCDAGGAGTAACKYTGSAPVDSAEDIYIDGGTNVGAVDRQDDQFTGIGVQNTGTAVDTTDISAVKFWLDAGGAGFQGTGTDTLLGSGTVNSGDSKEWRLGGLVTAIPNGGARIFVSTDMAAAPTNARTMIFQIPVYNDVSADGFAAADNDRGVFMASNNDGPTNAAVTNANTQTIDSSKPTFGSTDSTSDTNNDGTVDQVTIKFSEAVNIVDGNAGDGFGSLALNSGCAIPNADYAASGVTELVISGLTGCTAGNTGITPQVTYTAVANCATAGAICDVPGNQMNNGNSRIINDGAKPVLTAVTKSLTSNRNVITFTYSENVTVTDGASGAANGDTTVAGTVAGFGGFATAGDVTVPTAKNTVSGNGTANISVLLANEVGGYMDSASSAEPSGVFTPVAAAAVVDANSNQVNTLAAAPTSTSGSAWDLAKPTLTSVALREGTVNGKVDQAFVTFSAAVRDSNITNADATLGGGAGTFTTGTADDATTTFDLSADTLAVDTSATAAQFNYSGATTKITDLAGNLLDTASDGTVANGDVVETDDASPVVSAVDFKTTAVTGITYNSVQLTYSEAITVSTDGGGDADIAPGASAASTATMGGMTVAKALTGLGGWNGVSDMATNATTDNTVSLDGTGKILTVVFNSQAGSYFSAGSTAPTTPVFTPSSNASNVQDAVAKAVSAAYTPTATNSAAWDVAAPTISNTYSCDPGAASKITRIQATFNESVLDTSVVAGNFEGDNDATNDGTGEEVPVSMNTATLGCDGLANDADADDDKVRFDFTTGIAGTEAAFLNHVTPTARDWAGNLLATGSGLGTENDKAAPIPTDANITVAKNEVAGDAGIANATDVMTVVWAAAADGATDVATGNANFADFGGGAVALEDDGAGGTCNDTLAGDDIWCATYTLVAGTIDDANNTVTLTAVTDSAGNVAGNVADGTTFTVDNQSPAVTDGNISIAGTALGTGGAYKVGSTVTATWNNSAGGDNNLDTLTAITADLSGWGGGAAVAMTDTTDCGGANADNIYEACYTVIAGAIDATNVNVSVTATDNAGNITTTADTTNATVDNQAPNITANGTLTITTDNNVASVAGLTDKVTQSAVTLAVADTDTVTINLAALTGQAALAATTESTVVTTAGALDNAAQTFTITATDNAGNTVTSASDALSVDNIAPVVTTANILVTNCSGTGGACKFGDAPVLRWDMNADAETDTLTSVAFNGANFKAGDTALAGALNVNVYDATLSGAMDAQDDAGNTVTATVTDNAGNVTGPITSATGYTIDTNVPVISATAPATSATIGVEQVSYTLSEAAASGAVVFTRTGGTADAGSPHTCTLQGTALSTGAHADLALAVGANACAAWTSLVSGAIYTVTFNATDDAANAAATITNTSVTFDSTVITISATAPALNGSLSTQQISYTLSELAISGAVVFTRTGGTADAGSPHTCTLQGTALSTGAHTDLALAAGANACAAWAAPLVNGTIYTVTFDATDAGANPAATVTNTGVTFDTTAPILAEVTPVPASSTNTTPSYTFSSDEVGTISYGGGCASATTAAVAANNTVVFNALAVGTYAACTVTVTDAAGNASAALPVTAFTITSAAVACNDGVDNDSDGLIDMNDTGCSVGTDTSEVNEVSAGGGGGGGGGANVVSNSNTTTSLVPSTIGTVSGNQTYSRPVVMEPSAITVNTEDQTKIAQVTSNGTLTLRPNAKSTISLTIPPDTTVSGTKEWSGQIDPPVVTTMPALGIKGAEISGTKDRLFKSNVEVFVKVGAKSSNLNFSNDITLSIPVDLPDGSEVSLYSSGDGLVWIPQGTGVVQNGKLILKTNHLTYFAVENKGGVVVKPKIQIVFEDITGHWGEVFILNIANLGIVSGKTATEFAPNDAITRAEITKIAAKAFGLSVAPVVNSNPFDDVPSAAWFAPFIAAAQSEGIISGYRDGNFRPNNRVTRAEALKILIAAAAFGDVDEYFDTNYVGRMGWTFAAFPDVALDAWFAKFVAYAKDKGIAGGYADGNFKPTNEITRAEVAKLVTKILEMK